MKLILLLGAIFLYALPTVAQTHFYLDEPFKHPAMIPDGLVSLLRDEIKSVCRGDAAFQTTDVRSLFSASRIILNHRPAFILKSGHICLTGADNDWFWVYLKVQNVYRKILNGGTICLKVFRTRAHSMPDIENNIATPAARSRKIYTING